MENGELFATLMIFALLGNLSKLNCSRASQKLRINPIAAIVAIATITSIAAISPIATISSIATIISTRPLLKSTIYQLHKQIAQNNHNKTLLYQLFFVTLHRFL